MSKNKTITVESEFEAKNDNGRRYSEIDMERFVEAINRVSDEINNATKSLGTLEHKSKWLIPEITKKEANLPAGVHVAYIPPEGVNPVAIEKHLINAKKLIEDGKVLA